MNFGRAKFHLLKEIVEVIPWDIVLKHKGTDQSWQLFKDTFHRVEEFLIPRQKNQVAKAGNWCG